MEVVCHVDVFGWIKSLEWFAIEAVVTNFGCNTVVNLEDLLQHLIFIDFQCIY